MKTNFIRIVSVIAAAVLILCTLASCGESEAKVIKTLTDCEIGEIDGIGYELWKDNGTTSMDIMDDGRFSCEWSNINNALFRRGLKFDCTKTWQEIGNITLEYDVDYNPDGNSYLALYGWTREPLVEYYIVESWGNWRPPGGNPTTTISIDGVTYDIYETMRFNQPSIDGNTTFPQYWAVRDKKSEKGKINVGSVFATWEALGMKMGKLYEASLTVEGYQSAGKATINKNKLTVEGGIPKAAEGAGPEEPDELGYYVNSDFESGNGGWESRGSSGIKTTDKAAHSGSKSLAVTGRQDAWNGVGRSLRTNTFLPGSAYSFSVYVMQDSKDSETFKLTLQYNANGQTSYAGIAEAEGSKGEWVKLSSESFAIPDGASGLLLYVETDQGTADFYIDDAIIAVDGTVTE